MEPAGVEITLLPVKTRAIQQEKDEFCEEAKKKKKKVLSKLDFVEESPKLNLFTVPVYV